MSPMAAAMDSGVVESLRNARISTRDSIACSVLRMFSATSENSPKAKSEKAMVVMLRRLSTGARRKPSSASRAASLMA